jgi:hypothetical protein
MQTIVEQPAALDVHKAQVTAAPGCRTGAAVASSTWRSLRAGSRPARVVAGETDPIVLAELARRQMRKRISALREALQGHVDEHHRLWIGAILRRIDFLDEQIERSPA